MGKPVVQLSIRDGYTLWAATYDCDPNPLLALEQRVAVPMLGSLAGMRVADLCAGTGRWMSIARSQAAEVMGVDLNPEMLARAARKPGLLGRTVIGDVERIPLANESFDLAICSFGISYTPSIARALREMARIARRVMVSDMHPVAARAGWSRSFTSASGTWRIAHSIPSFADLEAAANAAGLVPECSVQFCFGEPEREIFARAGKQHLFDQVSRIPAIFVKLWVQRC